MSFYDPFAATGVRLLAKVGASATLSRNTPGVYDPATSTVARTLTSETVTAAVFPIADRFVDGSNILSTDQRALISASAALAPRAGDVLTWNGAALSVVRVKTLAPGQVVCLYECQVRS